MHRLPQEVRRGKGPIYQRDQIALACFFGKLLSFAVFGTLERHWVAPAVVFSPPGIRPAGALKPKGRVRTLSVLLGTCLRD